MTKCGTTRSNDNSSIDRRTVLVNCHLVERGFEYLILEESKYRDREEHQWPIDGLMDHTVDPSFDSERVLSGEEKIFLSTD